MGHLEYKILPEFKLTIKYVTNVDDCFIISDSERVSSLLFDKLNSLHSATMFTKETEVNNQTSFFDVSIKR